MGRITTSGPCPATPDGTHGWWPAMRFNWPWGLPFPDVTRCLFCGARKRRDDR